MCISHNMPSVEHSPVGPTGVTVNMPDVRNARRAAAQRARAARAADGVDLSVAKRLFAATGNDAAN